MVDLTTLALAALLHPSRDIIVHRESGEAHALSQAQIWRLFDEDDSFEPKSKLVEELRNEKECFAVFPHYESSYWKKFRESWIKEEKGLGKKEKAALAGKHSLFLSYLKKKGLLEQCAIDLLYANAKDIGDWAFLNDIIEVEADEEQYQALRESLELYAEQHFEKRYLSMTLFGIGGTDVLDCETVFSVMGHDSDVVGISFYIGYGANQFYSAFEHNPGKELPIMLLGSSITFYVEEYPEDVVLPFKNPLGDDNHFTCASIRHGVKGFCYLGKVMIESLIADIHHACGVLDAIKNHAKEFEKINEGACDIAFLMSRSSEGLLGANFKLVERTTERKMLVEPSLISEIASASIPKIRFSLRKKADYIFSFFPFGGERESLPFLGERFSAYPFVALLLDRKSQLILAAAVVSPKEGIGFFSRLRQAVENYMKDIPAPRSIHVEDSLSFCIAHLLFVDSAFSGEEPKIAQCTASEKELLDEVREEMTDSFFGDLRDHSA